MGWQKVWGVTRPFAMGLSYRDEIARSMIMKTVCGSRYEYQSEYQYKYKYQCQSEYQST